ncbi:MAG: helix-turn-helix domain-containing protein [Verrucomicrobiaceae bacterium]|nr:helix-turn-helix domain-containing protein [Verrucomicrobiaceae bacterium]
MNTTTSHLNARERFIQNLAESELFQHYQKAFNTLTSLPLNLEAAPEDCRIDSVVTRAGVAGVVETKVPVKVGKNVIALMLTGAVRLQPANADTFAPVAKALLDEDRSAAEIRGAKVHFEHVPVMAPERYDAAIAILQSFALQLGDSAHRMLFANATHEPEAVRNAKSFIHQHLAEPMSLEAVARAVNVSPFHFCKLFKRATGLTFTDFVNRARVEKAKRMLMKPAARITEVAYDVGFQSLSHFNRSFRRIASESPTEFRGRMKHGAPALAAA